MESSAARLNRHEASDYLFKKHGIRRSPSTLAKYASVGGGPIFRKANRAVLYDLPALDAYVASILSDPKTSTSDE
jgi:hypothetical protein